MALGKTGWCEDLRPLRPARWKVRSTQEIADRIFTLKADGYPYREIAIEVGLSNAQVAKIATFQTRWRPSS